MTFASDLNRFKNKTDKRLNLVVKKIVFDIGSSLVMKTPVGDPKYWIRPAPPGYVGGRARGNWQYALTAPNLNETGKIDASGASVISSIFKEIPDVAAGKVHYITNTLDYIGRLEDGYSRQAPNGMMRLTVLEFQPIIRQAVAQLR